MTIATEHTAQAAKTESVPGTAADTHVELRPADTVMSMHDLGGARSTRHSFTRALIRHAAAADWRIDRTRFDLDSAGRGTAVYEVRAEGHLWSLVVFSQIIDESIRTDRVIAEAWDVTSALVEGTVDDEALERLRPQVSRQEEGRAEAGTLIWGRANRSARFFDIVARRLAEGRQPDPDTFGLSPYLLRSTAFYSNGKFGIRDFEGFPADHPLAVPYRAHMLAAWMLREFGYDLVEHCATALNPDAVRLRGDWRRYLGLGNATGLGLVPYAVQHPEILNSWIHARELPLAHALARRDAPESDAVETVVAQLDRFLLFLREQGDDDCAPYTPGGRIAERVAPLRALLGEYRRSGTMDGTPIELPWRELHDRAAAIGPEERGIIASAVVELTGDLDAEIEAGLRCTEERSIDPSMSCADLLATIEREYGWIDAFDFTTAPERDRFWFTSVSSEEPRRAVAAVTGSEHPGERVQHGVGIARMVFELREALRGLDSDASTATTGAASAATDATTDSGTQYGANGTTKPAEAALRDALNAGSDSATTTGATTTVGEFLLEHPRQRAAVVRVQRVGGLPYAELRANLLSSQFVPLDPQRVQLAMYGMENYNPQSTDWLRVTLLSGAPRVSELAAGTADDGWMFPLRPNTERSEA
ncbi:hypothetical protein [Leucobacter sp. GX24907]